MDSIPEEQLLSEDGVKEPIMELEEGRMRLTAGKDEKWPAKEEASHNPLVKNKVDDEEMLRIGGCAKRGNPDFAKNSEPKRSKVTSAVETNNYMTQKKLKAEIKTETDAVHLESDQVGYSLPVAEEEGVRGSFNAHDFFSNEAAVKEEEDEVLDESMNQKSCPVDGCFEKLPSLSDLVEHMKTHPKPVVCGFCKKSFAQPCNLRDHYIMHTGEKNFACHLCEFRTVRRVGLKTHLRIHTKERPHSCTFCDKSFATSAELSRHLRPHTGERPYVCNTCGFRTTQGSSLKTHQRTHTGEAPYPCTSCDKRFKSSSDLTRHNRIHTGEKPYGCDFCEKRFTRPSGWRKHLRTHMGTI